tara:strand:+ start:7572 stop:7745 length:174 start_codon:yes stop_codon:yes gene_type:complete
MISLIIFIVVLGLIYWVVSLVPIPAPFAIIVKVLFIIIAVVTVLSAFGLNTNLTLLK